MATSRVHGARLLLGRELYPGPNLRLLPQGLGPPTDCRQCLRDDLLFAYVVSILLDPARHAWSVIGPRIMVLDPPRHGL